MAFGDSNSHDKDAHPSKGDNIQKYSLASLKFEVMICDGYGIFSPLKVVHCFCNNHTKQTEASNLRIIPCSFNFSEPRLKGDDRNESVGRTISY